MTMFRLVWPVISREAEDAAYPLAAKGGDGAALEGANKYMIRFTREQIPPVNAFWSATMYDAES